MSLQNKSRVFLEPYSNMSLERINEVIQSLGLWDDFRSAKQIAIKPNLAAGTVKLPDTGTVTNPEVLEFVIQALLLMNPHTEISIVESDSIGLGLAPQKFQFQVSQTTKTTL